MQVSKFGGASVKNAGAVRNLLEIVSHLDKPQVIVVSAMGKMTNAFETLVQHYFSGERDACNAQLRFIKEFHNNIVLDLFGDLQNPLLSPFRECVQQLELRLEQLPSMHFDYEYDQIVSFGEIFSTHIISAFLKFSDVDNKWMDVRHVLKTDDLYRDANVDWKLTTELMERSFSFVDTSLYLTQGFLGGTFSNISTTLGREGSDYTAAIIGYVLNAERVTVWKDVPGILNADPRIFPDAQKIDSLSYAETIELSYYGAQVIHPKTLKPLQNKQIPLYVKSFLDRELPGTVIRQESPKIPVPVFILKKDQVVLTLSPRDFSFITEENLSRILALFSQNHVRINLLQTSALNFTVCVDRKDSFAKMVDQLKEFYSVRYNDQVELLTIRHYNQPVIDEKLKDRIVIDSQVTRKNARFVLQSS
ncbi:aspartate kinase [Marinilabilia salmonicolor]|uniref:aspartate kinase n=1 Tax=Marinilabilia salmonicolor TaxID=989 RepID=UPI00029B140A|nr:aspartate kinase [Marinilabilia salmonicolor]